MKVCIVDLASIFHKLWHINRDELEFKVIGFLNKLEYEKILVAIDAPPYKRKESYPEYKANRDVPDPELIGLLRIVQYKVVKSGFTIVKSEGWEADDVIATLVRLETSRFNEIFVYGVDKDLLQCCDIIDPFTDVVSTPETRFGIKRNQVVDYLALVGDSSDNIKGVAGVGDKTAVALLNTFGSAEGILKSVVATPDKFSRKSIVDSLREATQTVYDMSMLIRLNDECKLDYIEHVNVSESVPENEPIETEPVQQQEVKQNESKALVTYEPIEFRRSLEPIDLNQAFKAAAMFHKSGLYTRFKGPEQIMMTVMRGRELGMGATTSLELIDMIQGKPTMKAAGLLALVLSSSKCEYMVCTDMSSKSCTWETKRVGCPKEIKRTFTIEDASKMGLTGKDNWIKQPDVMLQWRCASALIRQVYPDLINGMYSKEEIEQ